ncbi:acyl-CoA dehydrogenase family protein [Lysobacter sp. BMK333-48F3]|uniref:acyl-CoA dehydrogenase family protein n=1 Tax=Lysobacter sp. BMK333-48F3 TaxID=2867962 RepID=UPI001C8BE604|nr:acyl-CoA dehydrogenase family protein [Lysobacter sp. BMK333-48F3]MBX9402486.1 acyl-CoA dehydrogenase family protein [Lysobacter sp. BMK333-48F3]
MKEPLPPFATHRVENQPPAFAPRDLWREDAALREAVAAEGGAGHGEALARYGALAGDELYRLSFDAHRDKPRLRQYDAGGQRIDLVEFHPSYHAIIGAAIEHGVAGLSWHRPGPGAHVARAALSYLHHQVEPGTSCPLTMTHAAVPVLRHAPALADWARKAATPAYDGRDVAAADKPGLTLGMGMTEKQGGSDVRANETVARPLTGDEYELVGHKWFFSAPMSDAFLVLAQAPAGLSCFLMPRWHPHGGKNALRLMRLKDKLGDWSNASSEVEFQGAWAQRIGEEGRGVATIIEMVMLTRLDCMLGSAAGMRMALAQALHHARHRRSFGKRLVEHALMRNVLADLAIESEAATGFAIRVAGAVDRAHADPAQAAFARIATAIGKYWVCKRAPAFVNEAQECLGGAGYVEESLLPRLYRQAPLNSIWEGSGNIQCLDVLRALGREPQTAQALLAELDAAAGRDADFDAYLAPLRDALGGRTIIAEAQARLWTERLALGLQAANLLRSGSPLAGAFCASRLGAGRGQAYGSLHSDENFELALQRAGGE